MTPCRSLLCPGSPSSFPWRGTAGVAGTAGGSRDRLMVSPRPARAAGGQRRAAAHGARGGSAAPVGPRPAPPVAPSSQQRWSLWSHCPPRAAQPWHTALPSSCQLPAGTPRPPWVHRGRYALATPPMPSLGTLCPAQLGMGGMAPVVGHGLPGAHGSPGTCRDTGTLRSWATT